jgi:hypothetical protein
MLSLCGGPTPSFAQEAMVTATAPPKLNAGLRLMMLPGGDVRAEIAKISIHADLAFAFGLSPYFDVALSRYVFLGLGPEFLFNVKVDGQDSASSTIINTNLRLKGQIPLQRNFSAYGLITPGFSMILDPKNEGDIPKGFNMGLAVGGCYQGAKSMGLFFEAGYQLGFQRKNLGFIAGFDERSFDLSGINYAMMNLGLQASF